MSSGEIAFLRDQVQRLNGVLAEYQKTYKQLPQSHAGGALPHQTPWNLDRSVIAPLLLEYDEIIRSLREENEQHRSRYRELQQKLNGVVAENERLGRELRMALQTGLQPDLVTEEQVTPRSGEEEVLLNLQQQMDMVVREKEMADERWRAAVMEVDRLERELQTERESHQWSVVHRQAEEVQTQYAQTTGALGAQNEELRKELRDTKAELSRASSRIVELQRAKEDLERDVKWRTQESMSRDTKDSYQGHQLREMADGMEELRNKLNSLSRENELLKDERRAMSSLMAELKKRSVKSGDKEMEILLKASEANKYAESAILEKDQLEVQVRQKEKEVEQLQEAINQLIHEAGVRTRNEVDKIRSLSNARISKLAEELQTAEMENAEKQAQVERLVREKRSVEAELERVLKDGGVGKDQVTMDHLNRRAIDAERARNEAELKVQTLQSKIKKEEMNNEQLKSMLESEVRSLKEKLLTLENDYCSADEDRLRYLAETEELKKRLLAVEKERDGAQRKYMKEAALLEEELQTRLRCYEVRLQAQEDAHRNSLMELRKLLNAQQRMSSRWKEECETLTHKFEKSLSEMREEQSTLKKRNDELQALLSESQVKMMATEKTIMEYTKHIRRMEEKVRNAEERALEATQNLAVHTMRGRRLATEKESLLQELARSQRQSMAQSMASADLAGSLRAADLLSSPRPAHSRSLQPVGGDDGSGSDR